MKIAIKKFQIEGQRPVFTLLVDGVWKPMTHTTSRELTGTTYESDNGIFNEGETDFFKCPDNSNSENKEVTPFIEITPIGELYDDLTAEEYCAVIVSRIKQVKSAFAEKYPAVDEFFEMEV